MNKKYLAILMAAFVTSHVTAGSLDVYGDIKVNGKTVIDAQGNYVGSLPNQIDYIVLDSYFSEDGLKKTYKTTQTATGSNGSASTQYGVRTDDLTKDGVAVHSYQFNHDDGTVDYTWVHTETYLSPNKWISEGHFLYTDGSTSGSGSTYYQYERNDSTTNPEKLILGGSYINYYRQTMSQIDCELDDEGRCDIEGGNYTVSDAPVISNFSEIVFVVNKTNYSQGSSNYDDCVIMQFSSTDPWTAIFCKGVGVVKGWNSNYSMELTGVEGSLKTAAASKSVSLHLPKITK